VQASIFSARRPRQPAGRAAILQLDPDLCAGLCDEAAAAAARAIVRAPIADIRRGPWRPRRRKAEAGTLGLLVLSGMLCRTVAAGQDSTTELLGAGDLLRPWDDDDSVALNGRVSWQIVDDAHLAVLDRKFTESIAPWPEIYDALIARALRRSRVQAHLNATSNVKRVDIRLLALLWYMAERWGRMTARGAVVIARLTHTQLASLVGARRPSVTTSLKRLEARGLIIREGDGVLVLDPVAVSRELEALCFSDSARSLRLVQPM
jgi:hypothetical protein